MEKRCVKRGVAQVAPELEKQVLRHLNSCTYEALNGLANVGPVSANKILIQRRAGGR